MQIDWDYWKWFACQFPWVKNSRYSRTVDDALNRFCDHPEEMTEVEADEFRISFKWKGKYWVGVWTANKFYGYGAVFAKKIEPGEDRPDFIGRGGADASASWRTIHRFWKEVELKYSDGLEDEERETLSSLREGLEDEDSNEVRA